MKSYFSDLYKAGFGLFGIAHTKSKNIIEKGMEETEGYQMLTSNLTNKYEAVFGDIFDCVLTGTIDKDVVDGKMVSAQRRLYFRGTCEIDAGCRFSDGAVPEFIDFEDEFKTQAFIETLKEGMRKSKRKPVSKEQFNKMVEAEQQETKQKAQDFVKKEEVANLPTSEELIGDIKKLVGANADCKLALMEKMKSTGKKINDFSVEELIDIKKELETK